MEKRISLIKLVEDAGSDVLRHMLYTLISICDDTSISFLYREMDYVFLPMREIDSVNKIDVK